MKEKDIDIICPKCNKKAAFFAKGQVGSYVVRPSLTGRAICIHCGLDKSIDLNNELYYFKIPVDQRYLYARTLKNLEFLKEYFKEDKRHEGDPELDFPAVFYKNRLQLVALIEKRIEKEKANK